MDTYPALPSEDGNTMRLVPVDISVTGMRDTLPLSPELWECVTQYDSHQSVTLREAATIRNQIRIT